MTDASSEAGDAFKQGMRGQWDAAAQGWSASAAVIRTWLAGSTQALLDAAGIAPGQRVLDIAAGAGDQSIDVARRVGPDGSVLATDLSAAILEEAKSNFASAGLANVSTQVADGENLGVPEGSFDAVICRLGLMFFPDPARGVAQMHAALTPGGRAATLVFSAPQANPCIGILMQTALAHAGLPPRDPFAPGGLLSLGKPGLAEALFTGAGFRDVVTQRLSAPFVLPSVDDYLVFIRNSAGPIIGIINRLAPAAQDAAWAEIRQKLDAFTTLDGWSGPNELLLTSGVK